MKKYVFLCLIALLCLNGFALRAQDVTDEPAPTDTETVFETPTVEEPTLTPTATETEVAPPTSTEEPPITNYPGGLDPTVTPTPENILNSLWIALIAALAPIAGSPIVSALVQVLKNLKVAFLENLDPRVINVAVSLVVVLLVFLANVAGFRQQLDTAFQAIVALVGITLTAQASKTWYHTAAKDIPVLGSPRKPPSVLG